MTQKVYPTNIITIIAYSLSVVICLVFGLVVKSSFLAFFAPACILTIRGIFSCVTQEKRHVVFAISEGFSLFFVIRFLPILFS